MTQPPTPPPTGPSSPSDAPYDDGRYRPRAALSYGWEKFADNPGLGTVLWVVPGLVIAFLTQFTLLFVVDRGLPAVDAVRASVRLVAAHPGVTAVFTCSVLR